MHRVIVFTHDVTWKVPEILIKSTLKALNSRNDIELVAICIPHFQNFAIKLARHLLFKMLIKIQSLFSPSLKEHSYFLPLPINLNSWSRQFRFNVLVPPNGDINDPHFITQLRNEIKPTIAISYYCLQKFSPELISVFTDTANYHNGILPAYRGLRATEWSLYHGEKETGFTFHRISEKFDEGDIFIQGAVSIKTEDDAVKLENKKAVDASKCISHLLELMINGISGKPQVGKSNYFSGNSYEAISRINNPSSVSSDELIRRLKAFGGLWIKFNDGSYKVTKLRQVPDCFWEKHKLIFRTSDGIIMKAVRFKHLPYRIFVVLEWIRNVVLKINLF